MPYQNHVTPKEVGKEHSMVAERRRLAREREELAAQGKNTLYAEATAPAPREALRRKPSGAAWKPKWMK